MNTKHKKNSYPRNYIPIYMPKYNIIFILFYELTSTWNMKMICIHYYNNIIFDLYVNLTGNIL